MPRPHTHTHVTFHTHTHTESASIGRDYRNSNINLHTLHFIRERVIERDRRGGGRRGVGLSLVTTCNCHSPFSCLPPPVMHSKADAVLIRRCGKSNLHTESQLANDLAIFGANCVAKWGRGRGRERGRGVKTHLPCQTAGRKPEIVKCNSAINNRGKPRASPSRSIINSKAHRGGGEGAWQEW